MLKAKYEGKIYNVVRKSDSMEITIRGEKEGFQRRWEGREIVSYKQVEKDDLDALYKVEFYAVWNGERFDIRSQEKQSIWLWKFCGNSEYADKYGFHVTSKCEYVKEVPIEECDYFVAVYKDYLDEQKIEKEIIISKTEFFDAYRKYLYE